MRCYLTIFGELLILREFSVHPPRQGGWGWGEVPVPIEISCLNIKYYYSTLKYLSFKVLHDYISQNDDLAHFQGAPFLGGSKKGVRGVKKIGPQHFCVLYTLRVLQTKNQKMNPKIERKYISTCTMWTVGLWV